MIRKMSRKTCILAVMLAVVFSFGTVSHAEEASVISQYHMKINVSEDKTYQVKEEITAAFPSGSHRFQKTIQTDGLKITGFSCTSHEASLKQEGILNGEAVIEIGSDDVAAKGEETMSFSYVIKATDGSEKSDDIFDFPMFEEEWNIPVEHFTVEMTFPKKIKENNVNIVTSEGKTTSGGISKKVNGKVLTISGNSISAAAGLKCSIILPDGYWKGASSDRMLKYLMLGFLAFVPFLTFIFWVAFGRDPGKNRGEAHYPPEGMTPMEMGYIVDGKVDYQDAASMIIYFAQRGYLSIHEYERGKIILKKEKDILKLEKPFAVTLFEAIFENGTEAKIGEVDRVFAGAYSVAKRELKHYYTGSRRLYTRTSKIMRTLSIILGVLPAAGAVAVSAYSKYQMREMIFAVPVALLMLLGYFMITRAFDKKFTLSRGERYKKYLFGGVLIAAAAIGAAYYVTITFHMIYGIAVIASVFVCTIFIIMLKARTRESAAWLDQILNLKAFIRAGDYNTVSILNGKKPGYYYEILPYAYALGLMEKWSKTFTKTDPGAPEWFIQFGAIKEASIELLDNHAAEEKNLHLEAPAEDEISETENLPAVAQQAPAAPQKKGLLGQIAQWSDKWKPHPELDFIRKFNFDDFVRTLKNEMDRLSDGIVGKTED